MARALKRHHVPLKVPFQVQKVVAVGVISICQYPFVYSRVMKYLALEQWLQGVLDTRQRIGNLNSPFISGPVATGSGLSSSPLQFTTRPDSAASA